MQKDLLHLACIAGLIWAQNVGIGTSTPLRRLHVYGGNENLSHIAQETYQSADGAVYTELAHDTWSNSFGILFNAYRANPGVNGPLFTTGNTKYKYGPGAFNRGAAAIGGFLNNGANGGYIGIYSAPPGSADADISWTQIAALDQSAIWLSPAGNSSHFIILPSGNIGIGTTIPAVRVDIAGTTRINNLLVMTAANANEGGQITIAGPNDFTLTNENCTSWNIDTRTTATYTNIFRIFYGSAGCGNPTPRFSLHSANPYAGIHREDPLFPLQVGNNNTNGNGAYLTAGGTWTNASSRSKKERMTPLSAAQVLERIRQLPVEGWYYAGTQEYHIGPYAEDFHETFGTGVLDRPEDARTSLAASDVAGVGLLGIKALIERVEALEAENKRLREEINALKSKVE